MGNERTARQRNHFFRRILPRLIREGKLNESDRLYVLHTFGDDPDVPLTRVQNGFYLCANRYPSDVQDRVIDAITELLDKRKKEPDRDDLHLGALLQLQSHKDSGKHHKAVSQQPLSPSSKSDTNTDEAEQPAKNTSFAWQKAMQVPQAYYQGTTGSGLNVLQVGSVGLRAPLKDFPNQYKQVVRACRNASYQPGTGRLGSLVEKLGVATGAEKKQRKQSGRKTQAKPKRSKRKRRKLAAVYEAEEDELDIDDLPDDEEDDDIGFVSGRDGHDDAEEDEEEDDEDDDEEDGGELEDVVAVSMDSEGSMDGAEDPEEALIGMLDSVASDSDDENDGVEDLAVL